ncbi:MAG: hypothetical protein HUK06_08935 [Bacteroidaceae bacterium]|nr:hypothetical protein [Bacteroidaceae bacterium]
MEITFTINQADVYKEVAQTTSYTGAKMSDDVNAYERIFTTDEDQNQLERFWNESRSEIAQSFTSKLVEEEYDEPNYTLVLDVSSSFETSLKPSMQLSLFSFFVQSIAAKWYVFTNKKEAGEYADRATALLDDMRQKAFYKKKPTRPTYN